MEGEPLQEKSLDEILAELTGEGKEGKTDLQLPAHTQVFDRGSHFEIVRKWSACSSLAGILGTALFWAILALLASTFEEELRAGGIVLLLICASASIAVTYVFLAFSVNRTHIVVSRDMITVRHGPLPWVGNTKMEASNLKQLHAEEHARYTREGGYRVTYAVHALTRDGRSVKLVDALSTCDQARYIEHRIEKYLGIEDVYVTGQI